MTPEKEKQFEEMYEAIIRIDEGLKNDVKDLKHTVYGNGKPGLKEEFVRLDTSHRECMKRSSAPKQWPAVVSSICAIVASAVAAIALVGG